MAKKKKESQKNLFVRLMSNIYVRNILLMCIAFIIVVFIVLFCLREYTNHNETVVVPSLKGMQTEEVKKILSSTSLNYEVVDSVYRADGGKPGSVLEQLPLAESKVKKGRTIYLTVKAAGQPMVEIPDLKDFSRRQAEAQLNSLGFNKIIIKEIPSIYAGLVISVSYNGKELTEKQKIARGSTLTLTVGAGGEENPDAVLIDENANAPQEDNTFFE